MSTRPFGRIAVLGLGLLGGSVARAARERGLAREVVGSGRRAAPLERALQAGIVDRVAPALEAVVGADLVVLGTPVGSMPNLVTEVASRLEPGCLLTDVGSVKESLVDRLPGLLPAGVEFVGAHPMAGSHLRGPDHARADLFEGATCVLTPRRGQDPEAVARVETFWRDLGARVTRRDARVHDEEVAWVSHLPHLVAFAFAQSLGSAPIGAGELAGSGFRDFTRIAQSDAELWGEILSLNSKALAGPLSHFSKAVSELAEALEKEDGEALERILTQARSRLAEVASHLAPAEKSGTGAPGNAARIERDPAGQEKTISK
jgi:cyclohexadieny/prephenate dehydrogenase